MANITQEARNLIERYNLGTPTEIYRANALGSIIIGPIFMIFGIVWALITAIMIDGPLFLIGQASGGQSIDPSLLPWTIYRSIILVWYGPFWDCCTCLWYRLSSVWIIIRWNWP